MQSVPKYGKNRTAILLLTLTCILGIGYLTFRWAQSRKTNLGAGSMQLTQAEATYEKGKKQYESKDAIGASANFDETLRLADETIKFVMDSRNIVKPEERSKMLARCQLVKARAIRDSAFAKAMLNGKPIDETYDSSTREYFRSYYAIPDVEHRKNAIGYLKMAKDQLYEQTDVVVEALRVELLSAQPTDWKLVSLLCQTILKSLPTDTRSLYLLAKIDYEQLNPDNSPIANKDRVRMEKARANLAAARAANAPYWRTVHLGAMIDLWLWRTMKVNAPSKASDCLTSLQKHLFDPVNGALARAKRGEGWENLSAYDVSGILGVFQVASEIDADEPVPGRAVNIANDAIEATRKLVLLPAITAFQAEVGDVLIEILTRTRPAYERNAQQHWYEMLGTLEQVATDHPKMINRPDTVTKLAELYISGAKVDPRAVKLIDVALKSVESSRIQDLKQVNAIVMRGELRALAGANDAELDGIITRLKGINHPKAQYTAQYLEAVQSERNGRLTLAKGQLPLTSESNLRTKLLHSRLAIQLEQYYEASSDLIFVEQTLVKPAQQITTVERLSPVERVWVDHYVGSLNNLYASQLYLHYESGREKAIRLSREKGVQITLEDVRREFVQAAVRGEERITGPSPNDHLVRMAKVRFLISVNDLAGAFKLTEQLAKDYPTSAEVLRAQMIILSLPKPGETEPNAQSIVRIDKLIDDFNDLHTDSVEGKLLKLEWLVSSNRKAAALTYLGRNAAINKTVLDLLVTDNLLTSEKLDEVSSIIAILPQDNSQLRNVIRATVAAMVAPKDTLPKILKLERERQLILYQALQDTADGKNERAAEGFMKTIEVSSLHSTSRSGMYRSLMNLVLADPPKTQEFLEGLCTQFPNEPSAFLAAALWHQRHVSIGSPEDTWAATKTMWAALNSWKQIMRGAGAPKQTIEAMEARFLSITGSAQRAMQILETQIAAHRRDTNLSLQLSEMYAFGPNPDLAKAQTHLNTVFTEIPDNERRSHLMEAQIKLMRGDMPGARQSYEHLLVRHRYSNEANLGLMKLLSLEGYESPALLQAFQWSELDPSNALAKAVLIQALCRSGSQDTAILIADEFIASVKALNPSHVTYASTLMATGFAGPCDGEALKRGEALLKVEKYNPLIHRVLGEIAERQKDWPKAEVHYREAMQQNASDFISSRKLIHMLLQEKNDADAALAVVEQLRLARGTRRLLPASYFPADLLWQIGCVYAKQTDTAKLTEAGEFLQAAAKNYPNDPRLHACLAEIQARMGMNPQATQSIDKAERIVRDGVLTLPLPERTEAIHFVEITRKKVIR